MPPEGGLEERVQDFAIKYEAGEIDLKKTEIEVRQALETKDSMLAETLKTIDAQMKGMRLAESPAMASVKLFIKGQANALPEVSSKWERLNGECVEKLKEAAELVTDLWASLVEAKGQLAVAEHRLSRFGEVFSEHNKTVLRFFESSKPPVPEVWAGARRTIELGAEQVLRAVGAVQGNERGMAQAEEGGDWREH